MLVLCILFGSCGFVLSLMTCDFLKGRLRLNANKILGY